MTNQATQNSLFLGFALVLLTLCFAGCPAVSDIDSDSDYASSPDAKRPGAAEISFNATIVDSVDPGKGDTNDWKYFTVPAPGVLTITVSFDNPKAEAEMIMTDARGRALSTYEDKKKSLISDITYKAEPGRYYLHIRAVEADSDYSLQVKYTPI